MRELLHRRLTAFLAATVMLMIWMAVAYHYWQVHRVGRFLFDEQWKTPTVIRSASNPDHPAIELYGPGWSQREPIRIDSLPPHVPDAFVAAEDVRFRRHIGIDPLGIARAIWVNLREGGIRQGGSTITQQLVKSLILSNERTWRRKLIEIPVALKVERELTKDEILEAYLNSVYLGHVDGNPVHGIDEAAPVYLGRAPDELTPAEAALLAAIVPAPNRDNPLERPEVAKRRRDAVLQTMLRRGMIEKSEHETALSSPARFVSTPRQVDEPLSWYLTALRGELIELVGADVVEAGGLTIEASVDPSMQRSAELAIERGVARLRSSYSWIREQAAVEPLQAVIVSVDPRSGAIRSMVGSSTRASSFDRVRNMKRQPGSAFKTFVYLAAIDRKEMTPATLLLDMPFEVNLGGGESWSPGNYDEQFHGRVTLRRSFEASLNVPVVRVSEQIGPREVVETARQAGIESDLDPVPALPLGVSEVTPLELTRAYTVFPGRGSIVDPWLIRRVEDASGRVILEHEPSTVRAIDPSSAFVMHSLLRGVVERGTARRLRDYGLGYVAGKTGTTSNYRDAWFVGYSPELVTTAWVGFDSGAPLRLSSAEAALPMWGRYMNDFNPETRDVEAPDGVVFREIDPTTGYVWSRGCPGPFEEVFLEGTEPRIPCPRGRVGKMAREMLLDPDELEEPAAITIEKFRQWTERVDRGQRKLQRGIERVRKAIEKIFD